MKWYERIIAAHTSVTDAVSHYERMKSERYFVWQEDGAGDDVEAESRHAEKVTTGTTDLFTKTEFDPWAEDIERAFSDHGIAWYKNSVQYEEDTGFIHHEWVWEVVNG